MAPGTDETLLLDDSRLEGGEWLFRKGGQVFGPVDSRGLAAMLYRGELDPSTPVSPGDGSWRPVGDVPLFILHAKRAAAAQRVEREVTGARQLAARRGRRRALGWAVAIALLVGGAAVVGFLLARRPPETSALLEDFGAGISIASAARVGVGHRAPEAEEMVEVPMDAPPAASGTGRARPPAPSPEKGGGLAAASRRASGGAVDGGELVAAQFDERKIQTVVSREQRTLVPCFRDEATRSPDFHGDVPIEFAIGNDGRVAALWIDEPRFRAGALKDCLVKALGGWRFETFPGQRPTVSLAFRIGR
ncbi:AgmX/PglI C-terminal domain-containing protein [Anaeromyxobacter terrae]|uniref:AgmX/PglI C-terminal domain-containing protein n=1 Tax=Anaeromyxobacter terrae TaxID=2925406 RepID=UPI001F585175|nr:AgmX/PglI C-terminal domain-containing protein [Anaeromyxobacter sp. SG22]